MTLLTVASCEGHLTSKLMTAFFPRLNRFYLTGEKTKNRRLRLLEFQEGTLSRLSEIGAGAHIIYVERLGEHHPELLPEGSLQFFLKRKDSRVAVGVAYALRLPD